MGFVLNSQPLLTASLSQVAPTSLVAGIGVKSLSRCMVRWNDGVVSDAAAPILLGGYAAKRCPVVVQNDFSPLVPTLKWDPSPEDKARLEAGNAFEATNFRRAGGDSPRRRDCGCSGIDRTPSPVTVQAMESGAPLILGGWLPDDVDGARTGKPDILIRVDGGYVPGDVKNHKTVETAEDDMHPGVVPWSRPPSESRCRAGQRPATAMRTGCSSLTTPACCKRAAIILGPDWLWAPMIGTSQLAMTPGAAAELVFVWHDLDEPLRLHVLPQPGQGASVPAGTLRPRTRLPGEGRRHRQADRGSRR